MNQNPRQLLLYETLREQVWRPNALPPLIKGDNGGSKDARKQALEVGYSLIN